MRGEYGTHNANIIFSNGGEGSVATVYGLPMHTKLEEVDPKYAEGMANARLIAAAPETAAERDRLREVNAELVAALKQAFEECIWPNARLSDVHEKARAALAKATGGAS
jgi:hypothetical protein